MFHTFTFTNILLKVRAVCKSKLDRWITSTTDNLTVRKCETQSTHSMAGVSSAYSECDDIKAALHIISIIN